MRWAVATLLLACAPTTATKPTPPPREAAAARPVAPADPTPSGEGSPADDELGWDCSSCDPPDEVLVDWVLQLRRLDADGAMHRGDVRRTLSLHVQELTPCFHGFANRVEVTFEFVLNHRGEVGAVIEADDASLASCVQDVLRRIQFQAADGPTHVTFAVERFSTPSRSMRDWTP